MTYHPMMGSQPLGPRDPVDRRSLSKRAWIWLVCKAIGHKHFVSYMDCTRCRREWLLRNGG